MLWSTPLFHFINDLPRAVKNSTTSMYADDASLCFKVMLVSTKAKRKALDKSNQNLQVKINGTELEVVSKIKYL